MGQNYHLSRKNNLMSINLDIYYRYEVINYLKNNAIGLQKIIIDVD